jgi:hypothetical protein
MECTASASDIWIDDDAERRAVAQTEARRTREIGRQRSMLRLSLLALGLACLLQVRSDQRVEFRWGWTGPLPESCGSRVFLGMECPGCGLTRSFIYLSRGQWSDAWKVNRVGWLLALATVFQVPYRLYCMRELRAGRSARFWWAPWCSWIIIIALLGNWTLKQFGI